MNETTITVTLRYPPKLGRVFSAYYHWARGFGGNAASTQEPDTDGLQTAAYTFVRAASAIAFVNSVIHSFNGAKEAEFGAGSPYEIRIDAPLVLRGTVGEFPVTREN